MIKFYYVRCVMILRRFSVFSEGFNEHYVFDKVIEGIREEYGFEDKDDALRQCKLLNNKSHRNSFFNTNKKIADNLNLDSNVRIHIQLSDCSSLGFVINKNAKTMKEFITKLKNCAFEEVKTKDSVINEISFGEA